ncbi:MAG: PilZ domain-containing protein [Zoogloeaceae bacterium]|jgi:type IV pilus assembly protein PilZ|nr:PilZ domain-containing protein [Zoogloeaceae bacterium]
MSVKPATRPTVLSLNINSRSALYMAFIPKLKNGGIFIPTARAYALGDEVFVLLSLMDEAAKLPIVGKVVWITPANAQNNRPQGIGIHFNADESGLEAKRKIEAILGTAMSSSRLSHTL